MSRSDDILESKFQKEVIDRLSKIENLYFHKHQAGSIRGICDIIGCYKGRFFGWELKRSEKEARKQTGRIVLQRHRIQKIVQAGGVGRVVYPENLEECMKELLA